MKLKKDRDTKIRDFFPDYLRKLWEQCNKSVETLFLFVFFCFLPCLFLLSFPTHLPFGVGDKEFWQKKKTAIYFKFCLPLPPIFLSFRCYLFLIWGKVEIHLRKNNIWITFTNISTFFSTKNQPVEKLNCDWKSKPHLKASQIWLHLFKSKLLKWISVKTMRVIKMKKMNNSESSTLYRRQW